MPDPRPSNTIGAAAAGLACLALGFMLGSAARPTQYEREQEAAAAAEFDRNLSAWLEELPDDRAQACERIFDIVAEVEARERFGEDEALDGLLPHN